MEKNKTKLLLSVFFFGILAISVMFFSDSWKVEKIQAGGGDNVFGWAWSENIGWISFNNTSGEGSVNYGVNIDQITGLFSGYAWSRGTDNDIGGVGWISFADFDGDGDIDAADKNIPGSPCAPNCEARLDFENCPENKCPVYGWARALAPVGDPQAGGWDGWIKLNGSDYGVGINDVTHEFEGWAWGGDDSDSTAVIGWISFNCYNDYNGDGNLESHCTDAGYASDYKVKTSFTFNNPPTATNLTVTPLNPCIYSLPTKLSWSFSDPDGDARGAYQVQIDDNSDFSSLEIDSGKVYSSSEAYTASNLSYNTTYYWRLMVWDDKEGNSDWVPGPSINTDPHAWPYPDFNWSPSSPSVDGIVQICATKEIGICASDKSICYDPSNNEISCSGATFLWDLPPEAEFVGTSTTETTKNPQIKFTDSGDHDVTLQITDDLGTCSITKQVGVTFPLPEWQEVAP